LQLATFLQSLAFECLISQSPVTSRNQSFAEPHQVRAPDVSLPLLLPGFALLVATAVAMEAFDEVSLPLPGQLAAIKQVGENSVPNDCGEPCGSFTV